MAVLRFARARAVAYAALTQGIVILGAARRWVAPREVGRRVAGRVFDVYAIERWACCDCGLEHDFDAFQPGEDCEHDRLPGSVCAVGRRVGHAAPIRPPEYSYRPRWLAGRSSLATTSQKPGAEDTTDGR